MCQSRVPHPHPGESLPQAAAMIAVSGAIALVFTYYHEIALAITIFCLGALITGALMVLGTALSPDAVNYAYIGVWLRNRSAMKAQRALVRARQRELDAAGVTSFVAGPKQIEPVREQVYTDLAGMAWNTVQAPRKGRMWTR